MVGLLDLFTADTPVWSSEELIAHLDVPSSTGYRYIKVLQHAGLLARVANGSYIIGPRVLELDRISRMSDPVFNAGTPVIRRLTRETGYSSLLSVLYSDSVICVQQEATADAPPGLFSRGQRRALVGGASANIILAHLPIHQLRSVFGKQHEQVVAFHLGADWDAFKKTMRAIRQAGYCITAGEYRAGILGMAAPVFNGEGEVLGSIALASARQPAPVEQMRALAPVLTAAAAEITAQISRAAQGVVLPARHLR